MALTWDENFKSFEKNPMQTALGCRCTRDLERQHEGGVIAGRSRMCLVPWRGAAEGSMHLQSAPSWM